ncbi:cleft lip and palate associated transmembrane protein [Punctularia strigosozonata HHB-11173 SS5]|uniref:cleft lip and palate associated transmembrane protein n=1 Tax=Punctularia strigosozonata (strain HHB-11173) TaxID=741275 RepID=UPI0004417418|nr:cleft lip and palate associated transmembrane protein [Punctularia strigosozonata HHB-11173 SS5]EIN10835.1 cleft lip and palate associated transmembrane protein [Punctularia strigosozonata HHB-11173 SS5]
MNILVSKFFGGGQKPPATTPLPTTDSSVPVSTPGQLNPFNGPPIHAHLHPSWPLGSRLAMHVHLSTSPLGDVFSKKWTSGYRGNPDADLPSFVWENITFGNWSETRFAEYEVKLPQVVQHNGSLWADVFLVKEAASPDPSSPNFEPSSVHHIRKLLTPYLPKMKVRKQKKLLGASDEVDEDSEPFQPEDDVIVSHWHPNLTLALISQSPVLPYSQLPPPIAEHVHLVPEARDQTGTIGYYKPIVYPNDFWHLREQYIEINTTTPTLPLQIVFQPMSYLKFQMFASLSVGFAEAAKKQGSGAELDEIKRMLTETNPYFLALTGIVSVLHMVFEMLAFKNDVSHWRNKKELVGVSVRTIVTNVFVQIVILLYLLDNNKDTSWMIIMSSGMGVLIEAWKITKAVDIQIVPSPAGSTLPYRVDIKDKHALSDDEKKTQEYDQLAFRYVSYVTIPLLAGYSIYSLLYESHRGWYSFVISTLTSFVYMFGFAQLVPQLIINYKLKSVAHMPMKAMIYKTLSTVVDDLFAFCIKMPILHRLACFRDDVVFLIFLYQRWIYRIDPKRVNEYGQIMENESAAAEGMGSERAAESKKTR